MSTSREYVLSVNLGSSSLKFALFKIDGNELKEQLRRSVEISKTHESVVAAIEEILKQVDRNALKVISHRLVHSGDVRSAPVELTDAELKRLDSIADLAPLHLPRALEAIQLFRKEFSDVLQIGVFDTAFHAHMPEVASTIPLPKEMRALGIRRYGFHGLSFQSAMRELQRHEPDPAQRSKVVIAHLGSGSSIAAVRDGVSIDTTMSFSPFGGIMMGTRPGDLDPGILLYLVHYKGFEPEPLMKALTKNSGLAGVSGTSDMREILSRKSKGDKDATLAFDMYVYQIAKQIGAYTTALGGMDWLIFTGGIGENSADVRDAVCERINCLAPSKKTVVFKADEELVLAEGACRYLDIFF